MGKELIENKNLTPIKVEGIHENPLNKLSTDINLDVLKSSIEKYGILHPLTIYADAKVGGYVLLSGHKRFRAAKELGYKEVPCNIVPKPESEHEELVILMAGNITRNTEEEVEAMAIEAGKMWEEMSEDDKKKVRPILAEHYKTRTGNEGLSDFRPKNEYIRQISGISRADKNITKLLNEGIKNDQEEKAEPKQPKEKKKKNFAKTSKAMIITLQGIISEGAEEVLSDSTIKDIEKVIAILSKYMPMD